VRREVAITIDRPVDEVWSFVKDIAFNLPRARGGTLSIRQTSPGPIGLGSTFQSRIQMFGFEFLYQAAVTEFDPPRHATASIHGGPFRSGTLYFGLEPAGRGTTLVRGADVEWEPWMRILWPFVAPFARRRWEASNRNLKDLIEAAPRSAPTR
jgi:carbon monoxide dehydrogenase subunit G